MFFKEKIAKIGTMVVVGKNSAEVLVGFYEPKHIKVKFTDDDHHIPCETHSDTVECEVIRKHCQFYLFIEWDVAGTREIEWAFR